MSCLSTVVITGASSGFGKAFAYRVAESMRQHARAQKTRFILIARSEDKLKTLADDLMGQYGCEVQVQPCDLADSHAREALLQELAGVQSEWMLLINNAGLGDYGEFSSSEPERNRRMIEVNMTALVEITRTMLPAMQKARRAFIINVASLAADLAIPDFAMYAASKAFVCSFSEALRIELAKSHIHVTAVCPGPSHTGFGDVARRTGKSKKEVPFRKWFYTSVECVVDSAYEAVLLNRPRCYPSFKIRLVGLFVRNAPLWMLRCIMSFRPRKAIPAE